MNDAAGRAERVNPGDVLRKAEALVDAQAERIRDLARKAAGIFNENENEKSQVNQLERMGYRARSLAEMEFHIKRQAGKGTKGDKWRRDGFAEDLLKFVHELEQDLNPLMRGAPDDVKHRLPSVVGGRAMRHLNSAYLFELAKRKSGREANGR